MLDVRLKDCLPLPPAAPAPAGPPAPPSPQRACAPSALGDPVRSLCSPYVSESMRPPVLLLNMFAAHCGNGDLGDVRGVGMRPGVVGNCPAKPGPPPLPGNPLDSRNDLGLVASGAG